MAYGFANFEAFSIVYTSIGANYVASGALYTMAHGAYHSLIILNSLNNPIAISFDGGVSTAVYLAAAEPLFLNLYAAGLALKKGTLSAYYTGSAPTSGSLRGTLVYKPTNV